MNSRRFYILTALGLALSSAASAQDTAPQVETLTASTPSAYQWEICNETSYYLRLALGTSSEGKVMVRGWQEAMPGGCITTNYNDPNTPRFIYAESLPVHRGGIREWRGTIELCAKDEDFVSEAVDNCALKNLETRKYLAVNPSESRTTLIEPSDYGAKAETAGVQRMLRDAGYKITKIDGLPGRRTSRSLRAFKKAAELDPNVEGADLMIALKDAAQESLKSVGIELCNDSSAKIWGAVATREAGNWQSRGWWDIAPQDCAHLYTKSLSGAEAHIFALQENINPNDPATPLPDKRLRAISATPSQFCIAEARFSALGRDMCAEAGYSAASFRPIPTEDDGVKVTLIDADFAEVSAAGLRR
jgi:uncharacterized membrane protein